MRRSHFETLRPICPRCRIDGREAGKLVLASVLEETDGGVQSGILHCPHDNCRQEYPIIDGVPIIVPDVRTFIRNSQAAILRRKDIPAELGSLIGDAIGPGTEYDTTRQHLSIYCWGHYADFDPEEHDEPGAMQSLLNACWSLDPEMSAPALDLGCSIGRATFELAARIDGITLGVDLNFAMLRKAQEVMQTGRLRYDRRRIGIVYDEREFEIDLPAAGQVDFWACDALALPISDERFGGIVALNVIDCVSSPRDLLAAVKDALRPGSSGIVATPYDWSPTATQVEGWIGGHSQRGRDAGAGEPILRDLLSERNHPRSVEGLSLRREIESTQWTTRLHNRSAVHYQTHIVSFVKAY